MRRKFAAALALAALCAAAVAATYAVSFASAPGRRADARVFERVSRNDAPQLRRFGRRIGRHALNTIAALGVAVIALFVAALSLTGRSRVRPWVVVVIIGGALATSEVLKSPLGKWGRELAPDRIATDAFPSGHATLAMGIVLVCLLAVPARHRVLAIVLAVAGATLFGLLIVVGGLHPPSDVVGGFFVAGGWAALVTPFVHAQQPRRGAGAPLLAVVAASVLALAFAVAAGAYVESAFGPHRLLLALVLALLGVSALIVIAVGAAADLADRST